MEDNKEYLDKIKKLIDYINIILNSNNDNIDRNIAPLRNYLEDNNVYTLIDIINSIYPFYYNTYTINNMNIDDINIYKDILFNTFVFGDDNDLLSLYNDDNDNKKGGRFSGITNLIGNVIRSLLDNKKYKNYNDITTISLFPSILDEYKNRTIIYNDNNIGINNIINAILYSKENKSDFYMNNSSLMYLLSLFVTNEPIPIDIFDSFVYFMNIINDFKENKTKQIIKIYEKSLLIINDLRLAFCIKIILSYFHLFSDIISRFKIIDIPNEYVREYIYRRFKDDLFYDTILLYIIDGYGSYNIMEYLNFIIEFNKQSVGSSLMYINDHVYKRIIPQDEPMDKITEKDIKQLDDDIISCSRLYNKYFSQQLY